jgi:predicted transcriptional regulator
VVGDISVAAIVWRSLQLLARHGLVRLVRDGRDVRPEPIAAEVKVDFATGTYETKAVVA